MFFRCASFSPPIHHFIGGKAMNCVFVPNWNCYCICSTWLARRRRSLYKRIKSRIHSYSRMIRSGGIGSRLFVCATTENVPDPRQPEMKTQSTPFGTRRIQWHLYVYYKFQFAFIGAREEYFHDIWQLYGLCMNLWIIDVRCARFRPIEISSSIQLEVNTISLLHFGAFFCSNGDYPVKWTLFFGKWIAH